MARLRVLFRCIGEAVLLKGPRALLGMIPFGEGLYDIAEEAWSRVRRAADEAERPALLGAAAQAGPREARAEAEAAVREIKQTMPLAGGLELKLITYLAQVPAA